MMNMKMNATNNKSAVDVLKYHLQFAKECEMVHEKAKTIKEIPFISKTFRTKEEYDIASREANLYNCIFSYQMYIIAKDFMDMSNENIEILISNESVNPISKMNRVCNLAMLLLDALENYEESNSNTKDLTFGYLYATFLTLMDELKETSKANEIEMYHYVFKKIFLIK